VSQDEAAWQHHWSMTIRVRNSPLCGDRRPAQAASPHCSCKAGEEAAKPGGGAAASSSGGGDKASSSIDPMAGMSPMAQMGVDMEMVTGMDQMGGMDFDEDMDSDEYDMLEEPTDEVLDEWEGDPMANEILRNFQNESLEGNVMNFRDVYRMLEVLGLDREEFVNIFVDGPMDDDDEFDEFDDEDYEEELEMPMAKGKGKVSGRGERAMDFDEDLEVSHRQGGSGGRNRKGRGSGGQYSRSP